MKMSIEWHENCLKYRKESLDSKAREIKTLTMQLKSKQVLCDLYLAQIKLAKKENKDGFDSEKYALRRLCM